MRRLVWFLTLLSWMVLGGARAWGQVSNFLINGQSSGVVVQQGDLIQWTFDLSVGGTAEMQLWYDFNGNGSVEPSTDLLLYQFYMVDGGQSSDGPFDMDGSANGHILVNMPVGLAPVAYVIVASEFGVSDTVDFTVTPLQNPPFKIWGYVKTEQGNPVPNILVQCEADTDAVQPDSWWAFTDTSGYYEIYLDSTAVNNPGQWRVGLEEHLVQGFIVSPEDTMVVVAGDQGPVNFTLMEPAMVIAGQVRDPDGNPLNIQLGAWAHQEFSGRNRDTDVDTNGFFQLYFTDADTGTWWVGLWSPEWGSNYMEPTNRQVHLVPGDSLFLDFTVYPADTSIWGRLDAGGDPIVGNRRVFLRSPQYGQAETHTDTAGYFSFRVPSVADSFELNLEWGELQQMQQAGYALVTPMPVFAAPGDTVIFQFSSGGTIEGNVRAGGVPVVGAQVLAEPYWGGERAGAVTDNTGHYRISGLSGGQYRVFVPPYSGYAVQFFDHRNSWDSADPVDLPEGGAVAGIDFDLVPGGFISGTVDDGALPLAGVEVMFFHAGMGNQPAGPPIPTGPDGSYVSRPLPPGPYFVSFHDTSRIFQDVYYNQKPDLFQADTVWVAALDTVGGIDAHMMRQSFISGTVYDTSGVPLPDVRIVIEDSLSLFAGGMGFHFETSTNDSGRYNTGLPPGRYFIWAEKVGFFMQFWNGKERPEEADGIDVPAGASVQNVDFWLVPLQHESAITGMVRDEGGAPLPGIAVHVSMMQPSLGMLDAYDTTDVSGTYLVGDLPPGDYLVEVPAQQGFAAQYFDHQYVRLAENVTPVRVTGADTARGVDFDLYRGGTITGRVTGGGNPLAYAQVMFFDRNMVPVATTTADENGNYQSPPLLPMAYFVQFQDPNGQYLPEFWDDKVNPGDADSVIVTAGTSVSNIDADLGLSTGFGGFVRSQYGIGIPDILVQAHDVVTGTDWTARTDWLGRYDFFTLPPGDYIVSATDSSGNWYPSYWEDKGPADVPDTLHLTAGFMDSVNFVMHAPVEGKVVINELMWMGSSLSPDDEWIELRNTSQTEFVDISGWACVQQDTSQPENWNLLFQVPHGVVLPPDGHYLVSRFTKENSRINVTPDLVVPSLTLNDHRLFLALLPAFPFDPQMPVVDVANDGGPPFAGDPVHFRSMQRREDPGRGDDPANWYTSHEWQKVGWDPGAIECGTPGRFNWLPVELASFTARTDEGEVILSWTTASEQNSFGFEIQRREQTEASWQRIGFVQAQGTRAEGASYRFTDRPEVGKSYYYRLKMTDADGSFKFSQEIFVDNTAPKEFSLQQSYPNPLDLGANSAAVVKFEVPQTAHVVISVYNLLGQEVVRLLDREVKPGYHRLQWQGRGRNGLPLNAGVYFLRMHAKKFDRVQKLLIVR